MTKSDRANFGSKLGVILASAGSAVGLGNIWRFPFETGNHGGAAFILVYLVCVLILGIPIMIAEFLIGRRSRANTARAYQKLAPGTHWRWVGRMGVLAGFLILGYYSVVAGWTLEFIGEAATNSLPGSRQPISSHPSTALSATPGVRSSGWCCSCWPPISSLSKEWKKVLKISQNHDADAICPIDNPCHLLHIPARSRSRH